ncbi:MAG: K+ channel, inward rectifier [Bacteroidetes bacterium]|nr:K+ channel, inward rectifier [Bacteroidota bacterium]
MIKEMFSNKKKETVELGFGAKNYNSSVRFLNKDGSVNIRRNVGGFLDRFDIYHWLISISWSRFFVLVLFSYIVANTLFACIYYTIGSESFGGLSVAGSMDAFLQLFFFSAQTLTTVGYGHIYPATSLTGTVAAMESMLGLLGFAIATGILYGRFSRPVAHIEYSDKAVVAPYRDMTAFMFRIANKTQNELIETECQLVLAINNPETKRRDFNRLNLELPRVNFLPLTWTIVHPIDENSPMYGMTSEDLSNGDAEFIILIKSVNDTYFQTVYSRSSYKFSEVVWDAKFVPIPSKPNRDGSISINVKDIHHYERVETVLSV